jgi:hypothetical protein
LLSPHDKLKNASFLGAFLFIRLKKPMTIITKADKKVGKWGVGCRENKAAFCLLPFAFCLLPFAFPLLPFAFCLLPSPFPIASSLRCAPIWDKIENICRQN